MQCPPEIAKIVCEILTTGLLRIRILGNAARCGLEADHLHNLPALLVNFAPDLLDYYYNVERVCYLERSTPEESEGFDHLWNALTEYIGSGKSTVVVGPRSQQKTANGP